MPTCFIIAGVNGAGKTTFALNYLSKITDCKRFINADLIAAGLSPLEPERELVAASRIFLQEIENCITRRENFAFETTLAGRGYLKLIERLHNQGWQIELLYLALPNIEMSVKRVAERVAYGGHNISITAIYRRFPRSLFNLFYQYRHRVDSCLCFMNNNEQPELIFEQQSLECNIIHDNFYQLLIKKATL
jgi:predicted ABC-type ATPase